MNFPAPNSAITKIPPFNGHSLNCFINSRLLLLVDNCIFSYKAKSMNHIVLVIVMVLICQIGYGQSEIDSVLYKKIAAMFQEDQKWRIEYSKVNSGQKSDYTEKTISENWTKADNLNLLSAKNIIKAYGFPGYKLVGASGSDMFWAIVQHGDNDLPFQEKALLLMDAQVKRKNASSEKHALLQDRVLLNKGKKQLFGTQVRYNKETDTAEPFPIEDPKNVDKRRKAVGLSTLKEYLLQYKRVK
jgi:hypothetical protein